MSQGQHMVAFRRSKSVLVGLLTALTLPVIPALAIPALAVPDGQEASQAVLLAPTLPPEEAAATLDPSGDWQTQANTVATALADKYPNDVVDWSLAGDVLTIAFSGSVPQAASTALVNSGLKFAVLEVGHTREERLTAIHQAHSAILDELGEGWAIETGPIFGTSHLTVGIEREAEAPALRSQVSIDSLEKVADAATDFSVEVAMKTGIAGSDEGWGQAGGNKILTPGPGGLCTSGFVAKKTGSATLGVITAGHCPNRMEQISPNGNYWFDLVAAGNELWGAGGDIQFMRSPRMMDPWFHYDHGLGKPVHLVLSAGKTTKVCHYGITSGASCGKVSEVDKEITASGVTVSGLVFVVPMAGFELRSAGGDSGGPWYWGSTAYGIHKGAVTGGTTRWFTPIKKAESQFGVKVCLEPGC